MFVYSRASGRKMEKFTVSVNIAANSNVTFILTHEELLQRKLGQYEIMTRVKPKQLVQHFEVYRCLHPIPQNSTFVIILTPQSCVSSVLSMSL